MGYGGKGYGYTQAGYGYGTSEFTGFDGLSIIPDTLGWWSVARRVLSRYTGPAIRLRRSSDSAERDFYGIGPQGEVSTADVRAWNGWNVVRQTENISVSPWNYQSCTASAGTVTAPDGQSTARKIVSAAATAITGLWQAVTVTTGSMVWSGFFKADDTNLVQVMFDSGVTSPASAYVNFNVSAGTVTASSGATGAVESVGNGWFRCSVSITVAASGTNAFYVRLIESATALRNATFTGDGTKGLFFWGCQLERSSTVSPYEPRTTTSAGDSFLVTLYDQSGLARHFTQSTTTLQPIICEQGVPVTENGRLAAKFVAADARRMSIASSTAMFNALHTTGGTVLCVSRANDTAAIKCVLGNKSSSTDNGLHFYYSATEGLVADVGRQDVAGVATNGLTASAGHHISAGTSFNVSLLTVDPDNATASERVKIWLNGTIGTNTNAQTATPFVENSRGNMTLGARENAANLPHDGTISEVAAFSALISTADRTTYQSRSGNFFTVSIS